MSTTGQPIPLQKPPGYRDPTTPLPHPPPPPKSAAINLPPSFQPKNKTRRRTSCRTICCWLCIFLATLLILFLAAVGLFYLIFQPRLPVINLKSMNFTKFNITVTPQGPTLDSQSTIEVELKNPNKKLKMEYDRTQVFLNAANGGVNLGKGSLPRFVQEKGDVRILKFETKADDVVLDGKLADELRNGFRNKNLGVNVEVRTGVGLQANGWPTGTVGVKVVCEGVTQGGGGAPNCRVELLNWF